MNKINVGFDLFQMEQLDHILNEIEENPNFKDRFIIDEKAYHEIRDVVNNVKKCYNEALDQIGFTVQDHFLDKNDYPDKCNEVIQIINEKNGNNQN